MSSSLMLSVPRDASGLVYSFRRANLSAGRARLLGFKPTVRGVAKNPVDHPHGGTTKSIKFPRTPWGFATKKK